MTGVKTETIQRASNVITALRGQLDVCTANDSIPALTALATTGTPIIADLTELAYIDCHALGQLLAVRDQARQAGGDLVLASPQPTVRRMLDLTGITSHWSAYTSVGEAASGTASTPPATITPEAAHAAPATPARTGIMSSALSSGGTAIRHARRLPALITAASRKRHHGQPPRPGHRQ
jgi:anti-anti-sigma factor